MNFNFCNYNSICLYYTPPEVGNEAFYYCKPLNLPATLHKLILPDDKNEGKEKT